MFWGGSVRGLTPRNALGFAMSASCGRRFDGGALGGAVVALWEKDSGVYAQRSGQGSLGASTGLNAASLRAGNRLASEAAACEHGQLSLAEPRLEATDRKW
jgi:hypothetical protein